ncbi:MAG: hypothetical protein ACJ73S_24000 [Mycobacteriales bacterium]
MSGMPAVTRRRECGVDFGDGWLVCQPGQPVDVAGWLADRPDLAPHAEVVRGLAGQAVEVSSGEDVACVALLVVPVGEDDLRYGLLRLSLGELDLPAGPGDMLDALRESAERDATVFPGSWQGDTVPLERGGVAVRSRLLDIGDDQGESQSVYEAVEYLVPSGPDGGPLAQFVFLTPALDMGDALIELADLVVGTFRWEDPA